jgi:hypothetical protein
MPLDTRKSLHLQNLLARSFQGRQKTVVFVYQSGMSYRYTPVNVLFRPQDIFDPQIADREGNTPRLRYDTLLIAPLDTSFQGVVFIADTATATTAAVQAAQKYQVVETLAVGMVPNGTHQRAYLRRLR